MKLFSLRLTTLKSKLYAIVFASFVVRVVAFFLLPSASSYLAPDEAGYAELTEKAATGIPINELPQGDRLYLISRSLVIPATFLNRAGIGGLESVRIVASLYGLATLFISAYVLLRVIHIRPETLGWTSKNETRISILYAIFAFLPSHLVWSVLGLREAALEFWILVIFSLVFYIFEVKKHPTKLASLAILLSIPLVFSARPQVGWVLGATLLLYFTSKLKNRMTYLLIPVTLSGILLGYTSTTPSTIEVIETFVAHKESTVDITPSKTPNPTATSVAEFNASKLCEVQGQKVKIRDTEYVCESKVEKRVVVDFENPANVIIDEASAIPQNHQDGQLGAASVIKTQACPNAGTAQFDKYFCIIYRAPYTTFTFLFRPLLGADVTSASSLIAAIENIFWLGAALFVVVMFIRNRKLAFFSALIPSLLFFSIYTIGAGASEGNMGTAFRHKSLILWVVILLLASTFVATQQRKAERPGVSGSSQE